MSDASRPRITLKSRHRIARNQVFDVYFDHIAEEGGAEIPDYLVIAPRSAAEDLVTGVSVLPVMDGKIGLLRLYRRAIDGPAWEVPRGFVDSGEAPRRAAVRELDEEAGLAVEEHSLEDAGRITPEGGLIAARVALFIAHGCRRVRAFRTSELGHESFVWFSVGEGLAMANSSEIQDPSTLLLIYRLAMDDRYR